MGQLNTLANIPIKVIGMSDPDGLNLARTLMHELLGMLSKLLETGENGVLDLRALPTLGEEAYSFLKEQLGTGEVSARIKTFGRSEIQETAFPGIWWVAHYNEEGEILTELLEVDFLPALLRSQREDMLAAKKRLEKLLIGG